MADKVINITNFFSRENEENGTWFEPVIAGYPIGMRFCVYGVNSNAVSIANEEYQKELSIARTLKDEKQKQEKIDRAFAKRIAGFVRDVEGVDGAKIVNKDGSDFKMNDLEDFLYNSPLICRSIIEYASSTEDFLENKKND